MADRLGRTFSLLPHLPPFLNVLYVFLLGAAFATIQLLIGGTRQLFALPTYGLLAVAALCSLADLRRSKLAPNGWCLASAAVFFGWILARADASPVVYLARADALMVAGALIVYLLTACYLTDPRRRLWVLAVWVVLAAGNLAVGARQFAGDDKTTVFGFLRAAQYAGRASGFYICPDHLAGFLEITICLCLAMMVWSRTRAWVKILFGYVTLCCLAGMMLTGSRGGFLSLTCGGLVFTALTLWRVRITAPERLGRSVAAVLVFAALAVGGGALALAHSRTLEARAHQLVTRDDIRLKIWPSAVAEFKENPVVGTGAGTFLYYGRRFRDPGMQLDPERVHNDYLQLLAEYGLVGVAGLLLFLGAHLRWGSRTFLVMCRRSAGQGAGEGSNAVAWNIGSLAAVVCLVAHSVVDFNLHIPANALALAFVFGTLANPGRSTDGTGAEGNSRFRWIDLLPRLALPLLGLAILGLGLPRLPGEYYAEKARVALRDGHPAVALDFARRGLEHATQNPYLYSYLGQARMQLAGDGPDTLIARSFRTGAVQAFVEGVRLAPQDSVLQGRLGDAYARVNDFDSAEKTFRQAFTWDPNSSWMWTYYGVYLQQAGLYPQARNAFGHAMGLDGNAFAFRNLNQIKPRDDAAIDPARAARRDADPNAN